MRSFLCVSSLLLCLLVSGVSCQEDDSLAKRFFDTLRNFWNGLRDVWRDFRKEMEARTSDISSWTREAWDSFKARMKEWVRENPSYSETEKSDMTNYIEKLEMPDDKNKIK